MDALEVLISTLTFVAAVVLITGAAYVFVLATYHAARAILRSSPR